MAISGSMTVSSRMTTSGHMTIVAHFGLLQNGWLGCCWQDIGTSHVVTVGVVVDIICSWGKLAVNAVATACRGWTEANEGRNVSMYFTPIKKIVI